MDILHESERQFGRVQRKRYAELIERAVQLVADEPKRGGFRGRDELASGLRSFHVELAARRRGAGSHVLYYLRGQLGDERAGEIIARVLHERMEPLRHMTRGLP